MIKTKISTRSKYTDKRDRNPIDMTWQILNFKRTINTEKHVYA